MPRKFKANEISHRKVSKINSRQGISLSLLKRAKNKGSNLKKQRVVCGTEYQRHKPVNKNCITHRLVN